VAPDTRNIQQTVNLGNIYSLLMSPWEDTYHPLVKAGSADAAPDSLEDWPRNAGQRTGDWPAPTTTTTSFGSDDPTTWNTPDPDWPVPPAAPRPETSPDDSVDAPHRASSSLGPAVATATAVAKARTSVLDDRLAAILHPEVSPLVTSTYPRDEPARGPLEKPVPQAAVDTTELDARLARLGLAEPSPEPAMDAAPADDTDSARPITAAPSEAVTESEPSSDAMPATEPAPEAQSQPMAGPASATIPKAVTRKPTAASPLTPDELCHRRAEADRVVHRSLPDTAVPTASKSGLTSRDALTRPVPGGSAALRWAREFADGALATLGRPVRTVLVVLAFVLGVAALVGALGLTQSAAGQLATQPTDAGDTQIMVRVSTPDTSADFSDPTTHDGPITRIGDLTGVTLAVPVRDYTASSNPISRAPGLAAIPFSGHIVATETPYLNSYGYRAASGSFDPLSNSWDGPVAVLGSSAAATLGVGEPGPGMQLWLGGAPVDVVGVLAPTGDAAADTTVFVSNAVVPYLTDLDDAYILVTAQPGFAAALTTALPLAIAPQDPQSVEVATVSPDVGTRIDVDDSWSGPMRAAAWTILVVSVIAAAVSLLRSVRRRAPMIAVRRAMGARRASVWRVVTYEGALVGIAGGSLGALGGAVLVWAMARHNGWTPMLGASLVLLGLVVGSVAGVVASAVPAVVAARRDPRLVLHAE
jgi:ABC-type antimicrobial peptide transport system permease subunit